MTGLIEMAPNRTYLAIGRNELSHYKATGEVNFGQMASKTKSKGVYMDKGTTAYGNLIITVKDKTASMREHIEAELAYPKNNLQELWDFYCKAGKNKVSLIDIKKAYRAHIESHIEKNPHIMGGLRESEIEGAGIDLDYPAITL